MSRKVDVQELDDAVEQKAHLLILCREIPGELLEFLHARIGKLTNALFRQRPRDVSHFTYCGGNDTASKKQMQSLIDTNQ